MHQELETLLEAFDRFSQASPTESQRLYALYQTRLEEVAALHRVTPGSLDWAIQRRYPKWIRARARHTTLPPKA